MTKPGIYILSQPIHSGKTTLLQNWISRQTSVGGILTPDIDGIRKLYDVSTGQYHTLQVNDMFDGVFLQIGKYRFSIQGFEKARDILLSSVNENKFEWVVVDELGKLEMERKEGLEPAISQIINIYKANPPGKLLLVIRDYLLEEAITHYDMQNVMVLHKTFFE